MKFKRLSSGAGVFVCRYNEFEVVQVVPGGSFVTLFIILLFRHDIRADLVTFFPILRFRNGNCSLSVSELCI